MPQRSGFQLQKKCFGDNSKNQLEKHAIQKVAVQDEDICHIPKKSQHNIFHEREVI
jgi:hypothetical protein